MDRVKSDDDRVAVRTNDICGMAFQVDDDSCHVRLELPNTNRTHWIQIDSARHRPDPDMCPCAIQDQTIWIGQSKWGARKCTTGNDADLDVLTKLDCLHLFDYSENGFYRSVRTFE